MEGFLQLGYPQSSSIDYWDFPWNKPGTGISPCEITNNGLDPFPNQCLVRIHLGDFSDPWVGRTCFFWIYIAPKTEVFLGFTVSYFGGKQWISIVWYLHHVKSSFSMIKLAFCRVKNASTCTNHASFSASPLKRHGKNQRFQPPKSSIPEGALSLQPHFQPPFWPRAGMISSIMFARLEFSKNMFNKNSLWCSICSFYF